MEVFITSVMKSIKVKAGQYGRTFHFTAFYVFLEINIVYDNWASLSIFFLSYYSFKL